MSPYTAKAVVVDAPQLAKRLEEAMAAKGLSIRDLADLAKVDKTTIHAWRSGSQRQVKVEVAGKLATKLDTTVEQLLDMPPPAFETDEAKIAEQQELVRRVAALEPTLASLSSPPSNLVAALAEHRTRLAAIDQVLPTLRQLAAAADDASD